MGNDPYHALQAVVQPAPPELADDPPPADDLQEIQELLLAGGHFHKMFSNGVKLG